MAMARDIAGLFDARFVARPVVLVESGTPMRVRLAPLPGACTPSAALVLARRGVPMKAAHAALTEMLDSGAVDVVVPLVDDAYRLEHSLLVLGIAAEFSKPD